jgi:hypothetical protein
MKPALLLGLLVCGVLVIAHLTAEREPVLEEPGGGFSEPVLVTPQPGHVDVHYQSDELGRY